jgi:hypothetical protein
VELLNRQRARESASSVQIATITTFIPAPRLSPEEIAAARQLVAAVAAERARLAKVVRDLDLVGASAAVKRAIELVSATKPTEESLSVALRELRFVEELLGQQQSLSFGLRSEEVIPSLRIWIMTTAVDV